MHNSEPRTAPSVVRPDHGLEAWDEGMQLRFVGVTHRDRSLQAHPAIWRNGAPRMPYCGGISTTLRHPTARSGTRAGLSESHESERNPVLALACSSVVPARAPSSGQPGGTGCLLDAMRLASLGVCRNPAVAGSCAAWPISATAPSACGSVRVSNVSHVKTLSGYL